MLRELIDRIDLKCHLYARLVVIFAIAAITLTSGLAIAQALGGSGGLTLPDVLEVSRIQYQGNTFGNKARYPYIFNDPSVSGVQGSIHIDKYLLVPSTPLVGSLTLRGLTTSFSSKSEGALMRSADGRYLTYMGYAGPVGAEGVSNSYTTTPGTNLQPPVLPAFDRVVALIKANGQYTVTHEANAYSGDNPRAVISSNGLQFYMAGNSDSTTFTSGCPSGFNPCGPGTTIGARYGVPGSTSSYQLGVYKATDRPDESKKQHIKDNNFRGIGIYNGNLYVSKGSGGNGDDGLFQVQNGAGNGLPLGTNNTITELFGAPATDPTTQAPSVYTPFGFWFANATTLYVADEGYANLDNSGQLIPDPYAGLEKWSLVKGTWTLDYVLTAGLNLYQAQRIGGYPVPTYTTGLRNLTGKLNGDGTATIYAISAQYSSISGGEPDPTKLVAIGDSLDAPILPHEERFVTLKDSGPLAVFRGVSFVPKGTR
ncbi:MAG TPA: hypothetical protein VJN94_07680 [Candidatus Binataceae bacterium]|nr:hypothetical protein [Candidatus Binataceae bacterium]